MIAKILIAEDDRRIREGLVATLESEKYEVLACQDGAEALSRWKQDQFDLLVLDVMMPELSGYDVCREIRKTDQTTPILMLTAKSEEIDKVVGLKLGADDYLTKPFGLHELLARVEALLRRCRAQMNVEMGLLSFRFGVLDVDPKALKAMRHGTSLAISERELKLMQCFRQHAGQVLTRIQLLDQCWGLTYMGTTRTLDQHIAQLRKKVEPAPNAPVHVVTVHGVGYRYEE